MATIERALVAISQAHMLHGFPSPRKAPEVIEVLQGIRRTLGVAPNQKDHEDRAARARSRCAALAHHESNITL